MGFLRGFKVRANFQRRDKPVAPHTDRFSQSLMAKLFIGIAAVLILASAAFSFLAKRNIDALQTDRREAKARISTAEGQARTAKTEAEKAQKDAKDAADKADAAAQQLTVKSKEVDDAKKDAAEAKTVIEADTAKIADLEAKLKATPETKPAVDDPRIAELQKQVEDTKKELDEAKQVSESQRNHVKDVEAKLAASELKERKRAQQFGAAGVQGRILAVNAGWNFVVLSVGDKQGVSVNAPLLVVRGNEPIARLRITSVEPSTSIADVLPGSVRRGISVQPGDTVIFEGGRTPTLPPAAKTPEAATALPNAPLP